MKAEFIGDRKICLTELPPEIAGEPNRFSKLTICVEYTGDTDSWKALPLDKFVIPAIVRALNAQEFIGLVNSTGALVDASDCNSQSEGSPFDGPCLWPDLETAEEENDEYGGIPDTHRFVRVGLVISELDGSDFKAPPKTPGCPTCSFNPTGDYQFEDEYACRQGGGPCGN